MLNTVSKQQDWPFHPAITTSLILWSSQTNDWVQTYWWTWGWKSGWQQTTLLCVLESVSPEQPGSRHRECPEEKVLKITTNVTTHILGFGIVSHSHTHTCFLRLFITPMMLESCLYSSLLAHFLSLFFLEHDAFSAGEATPVMLSGLFQTGLFTQTGLQRFYQSVVCGYAPLCY